MAMNKQTAAFHLESVPHRTKDKVYYTHLLRNSYRENGKVKHQTIANLSCLPPDAIEALRQTLNGKKLVEADQAFAIHSSRSHGAVHAVLATIRKIGLDKILLSYDTPWRRAAIGLIAARVLNPGSKLFTAGWWQQTTLPEELGLEGTDPNPLYQAMDEILAHQEAIQRKLAAQHLQEGCLVLYDLSSTYLEGDCCPLAAYGHNRDGKKGKKQFNYGLLTTATGCPIAIEVFPGNRSDSLTVEVVVRDLKEKYRFDRIIFVGDRGMITSTQLPQLEQLGYGWITALRAKDIQRLNSAGCIQLSLFDEQNIAEITDPERPGERLVACRNPFIAEERTRKRIDLLEATEQELQKIAQRVNKGKLKEASAIGIAVGKVINRWKVAKHFTLEIRDGVFNFSRKEDSIERERCLDGIYIIRSNVKETEFPARQLVDGYKSLQNVEQDFRTMKTTHLEMRPVYHRLEERVKAHAFLCMLSCYVIWHMRRSWEPVLQNPKVSLKLLFEKLGSIQRNIAEAGGRNFEIVTRANDEQRELFRLLGVQLPL
jgi:transposase